MLNDLQTSVSNIPEDTLNELFADAAPDNGVKPDNLVVGKEGDTQVLRSNTGNLANIENIDDLFTKDDKEDKKDEKDKKEDEGVDKDKKVEKPKDEADKPDEDKDKKDAKKDDKDKKDLDDDTKEAISEVLTNTVNFLVDKGIFKDFKDRDKMKFTEELYAELLEQQLEAIASEKYNGKKQAAGDYGEAILNYIEKGGDPDEIIDLFKEQKVTQAIDVRDDEGRKELVTKWYKEVHGWKTEKIQTFVNSLLANEGALESEADEIGAKYKAHYAQQLEDLNEEREAEKADQAQRRKVFETSLTKVIDSNEEYDDTRKRFLKESIFKFKKGANGEAINAMYAKFNEWQADPAKYIDLAEFILDKEGYLKRRDIKIKNTVTKDSFNFVKGNAATSKTKGSKHPEKEKTDYSGTNFSFL